MLLCILTVRRRGKILDARAGFVENDNAADCQLRPLPAQCNQLSFVRTPFHPSRTACVDRCDAGKKIFRLHHADCSDVIQMVAVVDRINGATQLLKCVDRQRIACPRHASPAARTQVQTQANHKQREVLASSATNTANNMRTRKHAICTKRTRSAVDTHRTALGRTRTAVCNTPRAAIDSHNTAKSLASITASCPLSSLSFAGRSTVSKSFSSPADDSSFTPLVTKGGVGSSAVSVEDVIAAFLTVSPARECAGVIVNGCDGLHDDRFVARTSACVSRHGCPSAVLLWAGAIARSGVDVLDSVSLLSSTVRGGPAPMLCVRIHLNRNSFVSLNPSLQAFFALLRMRDFAKTLLENST
eukprot:m.1516239 g.1516239  ORF g.1516239 m.1516239 type:complete len:357 (+) comp25217_c0_seq58:3092-4162(+)